MLLRAKNWAWLINHVAGDRAAPSVLIMILICCNRVLNLTGDFRGGPLQAPLYPLKPGVSRGLPGLSGGLRGTGPLGPLVIWPLILAVCMPAYVGQSVYHYPVLYQSTRTYRKHSFTTLYVGYIRILIRNKQRCEITVNRERWIQVAYVNIDAFPAYADMAWLQIDVEQKWLRRTGENSGSCHVHLASRHPPL